LREENPYSIQPQWSTTELNTRVLINVPPPPGGVANFYGVMRRHLDKSHMYFETGARGEVGRFAKLWRLIAEFWAFHKTLSNGQFSLVHLNPSLVRNALSRDAVFLMIARLHSVPVLVFFRGWDAEFQQSVASRFHILFSATYGKAAAFIVLAREFRTSLESMGVQAPIHMLTTCVDDLDIEAGSKVSRTRSHVNILYLSRLVNGKGLLESLEAYSVLRRQCPCARITVAGDGPVRRQAEDFVNENQLGGVSFVGHVSGEQKRNIYLDSDIFFFPTFYREGMPNAVLEAMGYGLPVVTRPVGGIKDFFEHQKMGFVSESEDPTVFAEFLRQLSVSASLRRQIGRYNRHFATQNFSASVVAQKLKNIYAMSTRRPCA